LKSITARVAVVAVLSSCTTVRRQPANDYGVNACTKAAAASLLSVDALQCWFVGRHGRWRTLKHESHFDVLVVDAEALDLRDSEEIARRFVAQQGREFSEILVYVYPESPGDRGRIRRIQWTREKGFETLDFDDPCASARDFLPAKPPRP
jgi:hypothetical protein